MLAGSPGSSTTKQLGPLGERRAVGLPPLTRAHSGIHSRLFQSVPGPLPLPCPCPTWQRKGFLRCCDPILPLIKMLSDTIVVVWVSSLLVEGSARGMCSWRRWGGVRGWWQVLGLLVSCSFCLLLSPHVHPPKEAHRDVPAFPEGSRKGWRVQTIEICSGTL